MPGRRGALHWLQRLLLPKLHPDGPLARVLVGRGSLRAPRRGEWLPGTSAAAAALVGLLNLASALTPDVAWRARLVLRLEPLPAVPVSHVLAVPASAGLLLVSVYLAKRRRRAWTVAFALALLLVPLNLAKGLDVEEAVAALAVAALLWWGREAFHVRHEPLRPGWRRWRAGLVAGALTALASGAISLAAPSSDLQTLVHELGALLLWHGGAVGLARTLYPLPLAFHLAELGLLGTAAYVLFRPLGVPRALPDARSRRLARELVHAHGADTLASFKLRRDLHYLFSPDRRAFLAYRVERGVMLVAGDPVGPPDALAELASGALAFAELRGLKLGVLGAGTACVPLFARAGLRSFYIGDEAIVETERFSLEGRPIRKVRQSVTRLEKAGYGAELTELDTVGAQALAELEAVSARWLGGAPERGFSMALDSFRGEDAPGGVVVVARDAGGAVGGFIHFAPSYGRAAMSLSAMRRDRATPNGLMEFLVARSLELLRERGIEEVSLNFAAFARYLRAPDGPGERLFGRVLRMLDRFFQIERLYRFNAKFFPRWEPRYVLYEGAFGLPRTGLAGLVAEGQLPALGLRGRRRGIAPA